MFELLVVFALLFGIKAILKTFPTIDDDNISILTHIVITVFVIVIFIVQIINIFNDLPQG